MLSVTLLWFRYLPFLWHKSRTLLGMVGVKKPSEVAVTITFVLLEAAIQLLLGLPWGLWSTFVIEERHGFNKQTFQLYVKDLLKQVI